VIWAQHSKASHYPEVAGNLFSSEMVWLLQGSMAHGAVVAVVAISSLLMTTTNATALTLVVVAAAGLLARGLAGRPVGRSFDRACVCTGGRAIWSAQEFGL
jgi:di/tricarboxylate transporter